MADEQPIVSSDQSTPTDASAPEPSSEPERQPSKAPSWWQQMFHRRGDQESGADGGDSNKDSASSVLQLSQEELDRRIQAETDRREAKRANEARARQRRELRDTDPWQYAQQEREEEKAVEGNTQLGQFVANVGTEHDRVSIDPIFYSLPQSEQERIKKMDGAGVGLQGRKLVVDESLKALEKHWRAEGAKDAEARLRRNQAFRKQVLAETRGQSVDPELLPPVSASEADRTVSSILRRHYNMG